MADEILSFLPQGDRLVVVDSTAGGGGHLALLAQHVGHLGHVYAFDKDPRAHQEDAALGVAQKYRETVSLFQRPFSDITRVLREHNISHVDAIICDLGVSSHQLDEPSRGFSFQNDGPIDMRMNSQAGMSAYEWLENTQEKDIADALFYLGGERKSRAVASYIKKAWPIENSTLALARVVMSALKQKRWQKIHPATRTFQAIRMAVNQEIDELKALLEQGPQLLSLGGVIVFLSFHSGEDRLIKHAFKELALTKNFALLTKKPLIATKEETARNPRARSAKLRALRRIA